MLFFGRILVCDDLFLVRVPWSKALHDQRSPDLSQTESICSFGESVACLAQAARAVENEVLHAIADSERCLGAWYGVIFMLLAVVILNDP